MPSIPSVEAIEPIVMLPGEKFLATAELRPLLPQDAAGNLLESVVDVTAIDVAPEGLDVDAPGDALFDSTSISFWVDAAAGHHGQRLAITVAYKARAGDGPIDGSQDRIRKVVCPVLIRERDL